MSRSERTQKWVSLLLAIAMMVSFMQPFSFAIGEELAQEPAIQSTTNPEEVVETLAGDDSTVVSDDAPEVGVSLDPADNSGSPSEASRSLAAPEGPSSQGSPIILSSDDDDEGKLTIGKVLKDAKGNTISGSRTFNITLTGPSYPSGKAYTITPGSTFEVKDLKYGTYTVVEKDTGDYTISVSGSVTLSKWDKKGTITITNTEKPLGKVTIGKILKNSSGATIGDSRIFNITLTGPSYPTGTAYNVTSGSSLEVKNLIYGTYSVAESGADDYNVSISGATTLSIGSKTGQITVTNTEKVLGKVTVSKVLKDAKGATIGDARIFNITLTGPTYPTGKAYNLTAGSPLIVEGLAYGTYSVTEAASSDYTTTVSGSVKLSSEHCEGTITITNTEKALGKVTVSKVLKDAKGATIGDSRIFNITLTGPTYPTGKAYNLTSGSSLEVKDLIYGPYSVAEAGASDYSVTNSGNVSLSINHKTDTITLTNTEKALGKVTVSKVLKDAKGATINDSRIFNITLTGPSYPTGKAYNLTAGSSLEVKDLIYGTYSVAEAGASDYSVTNSGNVSLSINHKTDTITLTNTEKALGKVTVSKVLKDAKGATINDSRIFNITLTGPSYPTGQAYNLTSGSSLEVKDLIYGTYTVAESGASDYSVAISGSATVSLGNKEGTITITNTEKALGKLTINKVLKDALDNTIEASRDFSIIVTGPSYPEGQSMTVSSGTPLILDELIYGSYTVTEQGPGDYTVIISDGAVLSIEDKAGTITITNTEKALGKLTINKVLKDALDNTIEASRDFSIIVTGPSYPEGQSMMVSSGTPLILDELIYGTYTVSEMGADDYSIAISDDAMLSIDHKTDVITITNTEKPLGKVTISKVLKDADGNILASARTFSIILTGPSHPSGKVYSITSGTSLEVSDLIYGTYTVAEPDVGDYAVVISGDAKLSISAKEGALIVTNTEGPSFGLGSGSGSGSTPAKAKPTRIILGSSETGDTRSSTAWLALLMLGLSNAGVILWKSRRRLKDTAS